MSVYVHPTEIFTSFRFKEGTTSRTTTSIRHSDFISRVQEALKLVSKFKYDRPTNVDRKKNECETANFSIAESSLSTARDFGKKHNRVLDLLE